MAYYLLLKEFDAKFFSPAQNDNSFLVYSNSENALEHCRQWCSVLRHEEDAGILPAPASKLAGGPFAAFRMTAFIKGTSETGH